MVISAPVSSWIWLIILPLGPMTAPIWSTGILIVMIRGAYFDISAGPRGSVHDPRCDGEGHQRSCRDVEVRAADHHDQDPGRPDRCGHRAQGQDDQPDPGRNRR